ncbi:DUF2155 domain-containing protein [Fodinicurvata fenggangensis]|uniref:DUF2155 domain-containing protein n=1 Tax=Fodinicurvata fenggangensis TaxID=1121830 RepID=UPI001FDF2B83|nr:DUF2155 domain-containing protein [Fodinicurvata fenggangensis]
MAMVPSIFSRHTWMAGCLALLWPMAAAAQEQEDSEPLGDPYPIAQLQGLNKITARISNFKAPVDETVTFGSLEITARTCRKTRPEEEPESVAFLEIDEVPINASREEVFSGWMFASSPAVSALEHPVYDVWVDDCLNEDGESAQVEPKDPVEDQ